MKPKKQNENVISSLNRKTLKIRSNGGIKKVTSLFLSLKLLNKKYNFFYFSISCKPDIIVFPESGLSRAISGFNRPGGVFQIP